MGFRLGGKLYGFNSPLDLLRFRALSFPDRIRTGLGAAYITKIKKHGLDLDEVYACDWLRKIFGPKIYARIWEPLLRAKFGDRIDTVPAYWVWNTLNREKNGEQEVKGYLRGGYEGFADTLRDSIIARGGEVRLESPVAAVEPNGVAVHADIAGRDERFDAVVSTLPMPRLSAVARGALAHELPLSDLNYQGCVNAVVVSRRPLERFYWTIVVDPAFPFQGVVETTHVIPSEWIGNRHLIYCLNYCEPGSEPSRAVGRPREAPGARRAHRALSRLPHLRRRGRVRVPRPARRAGLDRRVPPQTSAAAPRREPRLSQHHRAGVPARHRLEHQHRPRRARPSPHSSRISDEVTDTTVKGASR